MNINNNEIEIQVKSSFNCFMQQGWQQGIIQHTKTLIPKTSLIRQIRYFCFFSIRCFLRVNDVLEEMKVIQNAQKLPNDIIRESITHYIQCLEQFESYICECIQFLLAEQDELTRLIRKRSELSQNSDFFKFTDRCGINGPFIETSLKYLSNHVVELIYQNSKQINDKIQTSEFNNIDEPLNEIKVNMCRLNEIVKKFNLIAGNSQSDIVYGEILLQLIGEYKDELSIIKTPENEKEVAETIQEFDSLVARDNTVDEYQKINDKISYIWIASQDILEKGDQTFVQSVCSTHAIISNIHTVENQFAQNMMFALQSSQYKLFSEQAFKKAERWQCEPDEKTAFITWNVIQNIGVAKNFIQMALPCIKTNQQIYLPRDYCPAITLDLINEWIELKQFSNPCPSQQSSNVGSFDDEDFQKELNQKDIKNINVDEIIIEQQYYKNDKNVIEPKQKKNIQKEKLNKSVPIETFQHIHKKDSKSKIQCRILSDNNFRINKQGKFEIIEDSNVFCCNGRMKITKLKNVIIHIHGGGWVSMSSFSHQVYSRTWAKQVPDSLLISIDYSLSPETPYPGALNECWQVYQWVKKNIANIFPMKNDFKILLTGDSAGGNMCLGICTLAIMLNEPLPIGLSLSYPALNLSNNHFTPSFLSTLNDMITPYSILDCCMKSYQQNCIYQGDQDPLLSPSLLCRKFLQKLPPVRICFGENDCLKDDCMRFYKNLIDCKVDAKVRVYQMLRHGYLNLDVPFALREVKTCIIDHANDMIELFSQIQDDETDNMFQL